MEIIQREVIGYINRNLKWKKHKGKHYHTCICGCGQQFTSVSRYHQFASRSCYSKFHRIPGFTRKLIKGLTP